MHGDENNPSPSHQRQRVTLRRREVAFILLTLVLLVFMPARYIAQQAAGITRENVTRLEVAWTYRTGEADPRFATTKPSAFEATPIVVDGTMYVGTPLGRVIALDPATGRERWVFDPQIARNIPYGDFTSRGVSTWLDESADAGAPCRRRIYAATAQSQLIALDARDGRPCGDFGVNGISRLETWPADPTVRAAGLLRHLAASRGERCRDHWIVDQRQLTSRPGKR